MNNKIYKLLGGLMLVSLALSACIPVPSATAPQVNNAYPPTLNVSGRSDVFLTPDLAYVNIGVHTESENVADSLSQNNEQAQAISETLQKLGVAKEDIQTSAFNIYPYQDYGPYGPGPETTEAPPIKYAVDNTVFVTVRELDKLGEILDAVVRKGANSIHSVQFDVQDKSAALAQARQEAIQNGRAQAEEMAQAAGVTIGDLVSLSVHGGDNGQPMFAEKGLGGVQGASSVPVSAGQLVITMYAEMSFRIQ